MPLMISGEKANLAPECSSLVQTRINVDRIVHLFDSGLILVASDPISLIQRLVIHSHIHPRINSTVKMNGRSETFEAIRVRSTAQSRKPLETMSC
jgi:hypothetical protein